MFTMPPMGMTGMVWDIFSQASKPGLEPPPTGRPVFPMITPAKRSGKAATRRRPISPPQSWQKSTAPFRSTPRSHWLIQFTWRS